MKCRVTSLVCVAVAAIAIPLALFAAEAPDSAQSGMMHGQMTEQEAPVPPEMMMRMQVALRAELAPDDPATVLALKDQLNLTREQIAQLSEIRREARQKTEALLSDEQRQMLEPLAQAPATMAQMHERMMEKMKAEGKLMFTCPMHPEVQQNAPGACPKCNMALEPMGCAFCPMARMMEQEKEPAAEPPMM